MKNIDTNYTEKFETGKLPHQFLSDMFKNYISDLEIKDERVIIGSKIGEDAAVIDMGETYLVAKTDPITFATNQIAYYLINVNVNDVVCTGAVPKWLQVTVLLPEKSTTKEMVRGLFKELHEVCDSMDITVVGGHTEVTSGLTRPIVVGNLLGEVDKDSLISTSGAEPGDVLILTKGLFIEGVSIIAREKEDLLRKKGFSEDFIRKCKNYLFDPGISVKKEALLAASNFKIKSMHDPTEGGIATGIAEMTRASNTGILIDKNKINILPEALTLSKVFELNPLNTISSGSLLVAINEGESKDLIKLLNNNDIICEEIGKFLPKERGLNIKDEQGKITQLIYSERDEITKIF
ncbi:MAG: Hydrogenase expression/formation protein [Promethearchaeota archaeon]|nr:MAG: Hydrogenase expression/formation protein [Candidatus Lokiarchaeota archaeon]